MKKIVWVLAIALLGAVPADARTAEDLKKAYAHAHHAKDVEAILALFDLERVDPSTLDSIRGSVESDFGYEIESIEIRPLESDRTLEYTRGGVTYVPSLRPTHELKVQHKPEHRGAESRGHYTSYLVGERDGAPLLVTAVPKEA